MACADDSGTIVTYTLTNSESSGSKRFAKVSEPPRTISTPQHTNPNQFNSIQPKCTFKVPNNSCSSVAIKQDTLISTFTSGHIRIYNLATGERAKRPRVLEDSFDDVREMATDCYIHY